jgi:hypothetical protein
MELIVASERLSSLVSNKTATAASCQPRGGLIESSRAVPGLKRTTLMNIVYLDAVAVNGRPEKNAAMAPSLPAVLGAADALRWYVEHGWCIKPCYGVELFHISSPPLSRCTCRKGGKCAGAGKHPIGKWKTVTRMPSVQEVERILGVESEIAPTPCNWCVLLGPTPIVVIDEDQHDADKDGAASFAALERECGGFPPHPVSRTGGGGKHRIFAAPAPGVLPRNTAIQLAPGLELLNGYPSLGIEGQPGYEDGHNHILIIAPSLHCSGRRYQWIIPPWDVGPPPLPLPQSVIDRIWKAEAAKKAKETTARVVSVHVSKKEHGPSPATVYIGAAKVQAGSLGSVASASCLERARRYIGRMGPAYSRPFGSGGDKHTFKVAAKLTNKFRLTVTEAMPLIREWNLTCRPLWNDADLLRKLTDASSARYASSGDEWEDEFAGLPVDVIDGPVKGVYDAEYLLPQTAEERAALLARIDAEDAAFLAEQPYRNAAIEAVQEIERQIKLAWTGKPSRADNCGVARAQSYIGLFNRHKHFTARRACGAVCACPNCRTRTRAKLQRHAAVVLLHAIPAAGLPDGDDKDNGRAATAKIPLRTESTPCYRIEVPTKKRRAFIKRIRDVARRAGMARPGLIRVADQHAGVEHFFTDAPIAGSEAIPAAQAAKEAAALIRAARNIKKPVTFAGRWKQPKRLREWQAIVDDLSLKEKIKRLDAVGAEYKVFQAPDDDSGKEVRSSSLDGIFAELPETMTVQAVMRFYASFEKGNTTGRPTFLNHFREAARSKEFADLPKNIEEAPMPVREGPARPPPDGWPRVGGASYAFAGCF